MQESPVQFISSSEEEEDCSFPTKQKGKMTVPAQKARRVEGQTLLGEVSEIPIKALRETRPELLEETVYYFIHEDATDEAWSAAALLWLC